MKTIYKYAIPILDEFMIKLPIWSKILAFQVQDETPVIWVLTDTNYPMEERNFSIRGTGNPIEGGSVESDIYIGTVQKKHGFVWHLFEVAK